jgi:hypothetical protein
LPEENHYNSDRVFTVICTKTLDAEETEILANGSIEAPEVQFNIIKKTLVDQIPGFS